jgi:hypothetical protein
MRTGVLTDRRQRADNSPTFRGHVLRDNAVADLRHGLEVAWHVGVRRRLDFLLQPPDEAVQHVQVPPVGAPYGVAELAPQADTIAVRVEVLQELELLRRKTSRRRMIAQPDLEQAVVDAQHVSTTRARRLWADIGARGRLASRRRTVLNSGVGDTDLIAVAELDGAVHAGAVEERAIATAEVDQHRRAGANLDPGVEPRDVRALEADRAARIATDREHVLVERHNPLGPVRFADDERLFVQLVVNCSL